MFASVLITCTFLCASPVASATYGANAAIAFCTKLSLSVATNSVPEKSTSHPDSCSALMNTAALPKFSFQLISPKFA